MRFEVVNVEQRSPEWYAARSGRLTGSRAGDALAMLKNGKGETAARADYRLQLAIERTTGLSLDDDGFISKDMRRGIDLEAQAIAAYEGRTGAIVQRTGFLRALDIPVGTSLDGHVGRFRINVEIKCPKSKTHISYLRADALPDEYREQVRHGLWVDGAEAADFVSYDDRVPLELQLFIKRVYAKDLDIPGYEAQALKFVADVAVEAENLQKLIEARRK